jgi:molybdate/tungstate transport system substrate-binding protein
MSHPGRTEIVVFHAASLRRALADAAAEYERRSPAAKVRLEPSGSQVAARKVAELHRRADIVAVADAEVIDRLLVPEHAACTLEFATGEIALAYLPHSRFGHEVTEASWPEVLTRAGVRLGRVNPDTAPLGYFTLFVWQLGARWERYGAAAQDLPVRLSARCAREHVVADESAVLDLLEARAIDYAFLYRSTCGDRQLRTVTLPPELNLSRAELADRYAVASAEVQMKQADARRARLPGRAITYGLTIPGSAANPAGARAFVAFLLGPDGQAIMRRAGFQPLSPARSRQPAPRGRAAR